jgi:hypothetical protein
VSERTVVITEKDGKYHVQNNGIPEFALLGILECIVFEMKSKKREETAAGPETISPGPQQSAQEPKEIIQESKTPDLRTRIGNAIKAIKSLGGDVDEVDLSNLTDAELQSELEELTTQYKRLKNSKAARK